MNDDGGNTYQQYPAISIDESGNFVIAWEDERNGDWDIYFQRYACDGSALGNNIKVEDSVFSDYQKGPSIASDAVGNFIISWSDKRNGDYDIYAQRYLSNGNAVGSNFRVNTDIGDSHQYYACISAEGNGNFIVNWLDLRNGSYDVFAQRYLSDGMPYGNNYCITNTNEMRQTCPSVVLNNNRIFATWQDNRTGQYGYDIWANVMDWDSWVGIEDDQFSESPQLPFLHQNYPNPFSTSTCITFDLPSPANAKIEIFNHFGQKVETLLNKPMSSGSLKLEFNAGDLPGGVYFVRMVADSFGEVGGFEEVRGMVVLH
nr:T9SS type A sorting domain-containing protein [Bacteroidota bacterium]